eukprot:scpid51850/ scgid26048/ 
MLGSMLHRPSSRLTVQTCQCSDLVTVYISCCMLSQARAGPGPCMMSDCQCPALLPGPVHAHLHLPYVARTMAWAWAWLHRVVHCTTTSSTRRVQWPSRHMHSNMPCCQCQVLLICPCQTTLTSSLVPRYAMCAACRESIVCMRWYIIVHGTSCITMHAWYSASASSTSSHHQSGHGTGSASGRSTQCRST